MLLIPAALLGYGVYHAAGNYDAQYQELKGKVAEVNKLTPVVNRYETTAQNWTISGKQPVRVIPDVDLRGVPHFWVDYGSGALSREYSQPVYLANEGAFSYPPYKEFAQQRTGRVEVGTSHAARLKPRATGSSNGAGKRNDTSHFGSMFGGIGALNSGILNGPGASAAVPDGSGPPFNPPPPQNPGMGGMSNLQGAYGGWTNLGGVGYHPPR